MTEREFVRMGVIIWACSLLTSLAAVVLGAQALRPPLSFMWRSLVILELILLMASLVPGVLVHMVTKGERVRAPGLLVAFLFSVLFAWVRLMAWVFVLNGMFGDWRGPG